MTGIPWTERTLDVSGGCTKCATGCKNCWAIKEIWRQHRHPKWQGLVEKTSAGLNWTGRIKLFEDALQVPLKTRKPTKFFVNSKADLFHPKVPFEYIDKFHAIAALCSQHTFQILTKRIDCAAEYYGKKYLPTRADNINKYMQIIKRNPYFYFQDFCMNDRIGLVLPNLWLGPSISTQADADRMLPIALQIPAAVHIFSIEPMLERVELKEYLYDGGLAYKILSRHYGKYGFDPKGNQTERKKPNLDWVIIGCESGPKARLCSIEDIRYVVAQTRASKTPTFLKQVPINGKCSKKPEEWPEDLRIQEYPKQGSEDEMSRYKKNS